MPNEVALSVRHKLTGILPPLSMPFDDDGALVPGAIGPQIDFMVEAGARGVVVGGSTGEGHTLSSDEFATAMRESHAATAGRVPVVAGLIVNSTREAIDRAALLSDLGVDALQVTPVHYLFKPGQTATIQHFRRIWEATGTPILIYNVIPWNYLDVASMLAIMDEVPGVVGMKQSSGDLKSVTDLLLKAKPENLVLTGIDALLYSAFSMGAHGAISALTCAVPGATVNLFDAVARGDHENALDLHFRLNALWNEMPHDHLPACVKYVQSRQGLALHQPRAPMERVDADRRKAIDAVLEAVREASSRTSAAA